MNGRMRSTQEGLGPDDHQAPVPRPARSPATILQIRVRNRRREYLRQNPTYLDDLDHELANPVKYESLIRHFQTRAEKDTEAQRKGYARILEGDLMRSEAKLAVLTATLPGVDGIAGDDMAAPDGGYGNILVAGGGTDDDNGVDTATTKEEGRELWNEFLAERFVRGDDPDFDYTRIDEDESLDAMERQDAEDAWFDNEEPAWASSDESNVTKPCGETGVQDF